MAIEINRAPVLTLWATVVAERLGFNKKEALSLGRTLAGLTAQSKGQRLGIFEPTPEAVREARKKERNEDFFVDLMGRKIPVRNTDEGIRALSKNKIVGHESAEKYCQSKFGDNLDDVRDAMTELAKSYKPKELAECAFSLYEKFRPNIPSGQKGWGAKGKLDLKKIRSLKKS